MKGSKHIIWFVLLMFVFACIEPFDFTVDTTERVLVIEGGISNLTKAHQVRLSYTSALDDTAQADVLSSAQVSIVSEGGNTEALTAVGDGTYLTRETFAGEIGEKYKLVIVAGDTRYESSFEELLQGAEIDSVYGRYVEIPNEETNEMERGIQFFLDTHDKSLSTSYYRYEWEDVYKIEVPFPSLYEAKRDEDTAYLVRRVEQIGVCYDYDTSSSLIIGTAIGSFENQLEEFPLRFIPENSQKLRSRIGILTKQYSVSENAYTYYRVLRENQDASGSLFDIQAGTVLGNMTSSDPDEVVLGFFEVAGVSERREYFAPNTFVSQGFNKPDFRYVCRDDSLAELYEAALLVLDNEPYLQVWGILSALIPGDTDQAYLFNRTCSSCDWYADTTPPDFWIE